MFNTKKFIDTIIKNALNKRKIKWADNLNKPLVKIYKYTPTNLGTRKVPKPIGKPPNIKRPTVNNSKLVRTKSNCNKSLFSSPHKIINQKLYMTKKQQLEQAKKELLELYKQLN
jgi:hypothetical protein